MRIRKRMTTVVSRVVMIIVGFFVSGGYAQEKGKTAGSEAIAQLYAGAKKEGTVIIWGPTDAIIYRKMQEALDKQYPGIKIEHFESIPEPLLQRISLKVRRESRRVSTLFSPARCARFDL